MEHTPVLIIGGSLVGLSASLFLAWRGIPHILVEKHFGSALHPRAMGFTETTIEHYRTVGIADSIPQAPKGARLRRVKVKNLSSEWVSESDWTPGQAADRSDDLSPCRGAAIAQDKLEPILRNAAQEMGAKHKFGCELINFDHHTEQPISARLRDRKSGEEFEITADFMIAADGATSSIREALSITSSGVGYLKTLNSVLFYCPEADHYLEKGVQQFEIEQESFQGFLTTYGDSRWVLIFENDNVRSNEESVDLVKCALGSEMSFNIITTGQWEMAGRIADKYSEGRVFLAGDSAHQLPPTRGGFGANTGIDDVWNLAWKLERVICGVADSALLDTYNTERQPIGWLRHQQTFSRPDYAHWVDEDFEPDILLSNDAMEFGQLVRSSQIIGAGPELPAAALPSEWHGHPGTRAPHIWVMKDNIRISLLDLFGQDFVLLTENGAWYEYVKELPLKFIQIGSDIIFPFDLSFGELFNTEAKGATLIRPDGIIAWQSHSAMSESDLNDICRLVGKKHLNK